MSNSSKQNFTSTINHRQPDRVVVDFGSSPVTGIHAVIVEKLRDYYGLEKKPVKIIEPYQMLGELDADLIREMDVDVIGLGGENNMFGIPNSDWKLHKTFWGQEVLFPGESNFTFNDNGDMLIHPEGDTSVRPSAVMPKTGYFFDAIERQGPVDDSTLKLEDNLEEFGRVTDNDLKFWKEQVRKAGESDKAVLANLGGTALGDIALVPAVQLKDPKGIRGVAEWYMSTLIREDFIKELYDRQTDTAIENLKDFYSVIGNNIDVVYICGADFGTQNSTFCSPDTFARVWLPYYRKVNDWIHQNTGWKTFKHSCGSIISLLDLFIEAGFDIINPVQINAEGMDTKELKRRFGERIVFWGGGVDTQGVFAFGSPQQVKEQVKRQVGILNENGGFVFQYST